MPKITGYVLDVNDQPVENATVVLPSAGLFALTDETGYYEIDNVPEGIQRINVVHRVLPEIQEKWLTPGM